MESRNITLENRVTKEQEIISLYYHNGLSICEIARKIFWSKKEVAEVLTNSTIQKQDDSFIVESIINYIKHF